MKARAILIVVLTVAFGVAPYITTPFRGFDPSQFPVIIQRPSIQPVGWAFSIWGLIYVALAVHAIFGWRQRQDDPDWDHIRRPLGAALLVGSVWLWIATMNPFAATFGIWAMLACAVSALLRAKPGKDHWLLTFPVAILAGWLTAAANVSLGVLIAGYGWLTDTRSAAAMLALTLAIGVAVQLRRPLAPEYGLAVIWALVGIIAVNWVPNVMVSVIAGAGIAVMVLTVAGARHRVTV
jgi:hypothetical protein